MSISKEIERLQQAKKDIGDAIVRKGGSVSGTIDTYANSIMALGDVSFRTAIDIVNKSDAKNVDLTMISPKNETSLNYLFRNNTNLININVSNWDTSNITSLRGAFASIPNLKSVDFADWDVSDVTDMNYMFRNCDCLQRTYGMFVDELQEALMAGNWSSLQPQQSDTPQQPDTPQQSDTSQQPDTPQKMSF